MFKNSKLSLRVIIVTLVVLATTILGVGAFYLFSNRNNKNGTPGNGGLDGDVGGIISFSVEYPEDELDGDDNSVSALEPTTTYATSDFALTFIKWSAGTDKLNSGDIIYFYVHSDDGLSFSILIYSADNEYKGTVSGQMHTNKNKKVTGFKVGVNETTVSSGGSITVGHQYDPNYTGTIIVKVVTATVSEYRVYGYYSFNGGQSFNYSNATKTTYTTSGVKTWGTISASLVTQNLSNAHSFAGWYLDVTELVHGTYKESGASYNGVPYHEIYYGSKFVNNDAELTENNYKPTSVSKGEGWINVHRYDRFSATISFKVKEKPWKDANGHVCYDIVQNGIKGEATFTQGTQTPVIKARFVRTYDVEVESGVSGWAGYPDGLDVTKADLHGVLTQGSSNTTKINALHNYDFYATGDRAFYHKSDMSGHHSVSSDNTNSFALYNYGHSISGYTIKVGNQYVGYDYTENKLMFTDVATEMSISQIETLGIGLDEIAALCDFVYATSKTEVEIKITPTWQVEQLWVNDLVTYNSTLTTESMVGVVKMFEPYDERDYVDIWKNITTADYYNRLTNGEYPVCLYYPTSAKNSSNVNYILLDGVWNYANIHHGEEGVLGSIAYVETSYGFRYTLLVDLLFEDNIYTVGLNDMLGECVAGGRLETDEVWASNDTEITIFEADDLGISSDSLVSFNDSGYGFVDKYIASEFAAYVDGYRAATDTDMSETTFNVFKHVYANSQGEKFIFIANNQELSNLPIFRTDYSQTVMWKNSTSSTAWTVNGGLDIDGDMFDIDDTNVWTYHSNNLNLYAHNAHRLKVYQDATANNAYVSQWSEWFGTETMASFDNHTLLNTTTGAEIDGCVFDKQQAIKEGYAVSYSSANSSLTVSKDEDEWSFDVESIDSYNSNLYFINYVCGFGEFIQARDTAGSTELPIVRLNLKWPNKGYEFTIDNSDNYWVDKDFTHVNLPASSVAANLNFGGAYVKSDDKYNDVVEIGDVKSNSKLKLMSSYENGVGLSFKDCNYFSRFDYAVYNYGHYISGWTVNVVFSNPSKDDINLYYSGSSLVVNGNEASSSLIGKEFGSISSCINNYYAYLVRTHGIDWAVEVTLVPAWEAVSLTITLANNSTKSVGYGSGYDFRSYVPTSNGQTFMCFAYDTDKALELVNTYGVWNYVSGQENYVRVSNSNYRVRLKDVFVDNIYKVNLKDIYLDDLYNQDLGCATVTMQAAAGYSFKDDEVVSSSEINFTNINAKDYEFEYCEYNTLSEDEKSQFVMDTYILQLNQNKTSWEDGVAGQAFSMFNNVYVSGATVRADSQNMVLNVAVGQNNTSYNLPSSVSLWMYISNNKEITTLPLFEGEYSQTLAWKDNNAKHYLPDNISSDNDQIEKIYEEQLENKKEAVWQYSANSTQLGAISAYRTRYYYEGVNTNLPSDNYEYVTGDWYLGVTETTLAGLDTFSPDNLKNDKNQFDGWLFNLNNVNKINGYTGHTKSGNVFTISHGGKTTTIETSGTLKNSSHLYRISTITGNEVFIQNAIYPTIIAKLNAIYDTTIDNTNVYWNGIIDDGSVAGAVSNYRNKNGTLAAEEGYSVGLEIAATVDYGYPFLSSVRNKASRVFYHGADYTDVSMITKGYYYVYNYGHYISAWRIIVERIADGAQYYLQHSTTGFTVKTVEVSNPIEVLDHASFANVASAVDDLNADKAGIHYTVRLIPVWDVVEIDVVEDSESLGNIDFRDGYDLDTRKTEVPVGQSLIAYEYMNNGLISIDGVWNYARIPYSYYSAASVSTYGNTTYTIEVEPVFVNNIYKVGLNDVYLETLQDRDHAVLTLDTSKTGFRFDAETISDQSFTYRDEVDSYSFQTFDEYYTAQQVTASFLMDNYISVLSGKISSWESGLSSFGLFNKVYYTTALACNAHSSNNAVLNLAVQNNSDWYVSNAIDGYSMWIYLVHSQAAARMPVFINDYAANIAWFDASATNYHATEMVTASERLTDIQSTLESLADDAWNAEWNYNGNNTALTAEYAFRARYYYEDKDTISTGDEFGYLLGDWYHEIVPSVLYSKENGNKLYSQMPDIEDLKPHKSIFYGWIFDYNEAQRRYGAANVSMSYDKIIINHGNGKITKVSVDEQVKNSDKELWFIEDIFGDEIFDQDPTRPIIKAKLGLIYDAEINNENVYWNGKLDDYTVAGVVTSYTKQGETTVTDFNDTYKANIEIANEQSFAYPFMSSILYGASSVFYHNDDYADNVENVPSAHKGHYYVYNYGHYLSGWKIYLKDIQKYLIINAAGEWEAVSATSGGSFVVTIDKLVDIGVANFAIVAEHADSAYTDTVGDDLKIVLYPQWTAATIEVKHDSTKLFNSALLFGAQSYTMNENKAAVEAGKSLMAYAYNNADKDNSLIATMGRWNYAHIQENYYTYDNNLVGSEFGNVVYTMKVYPVLVDNIYAVELQNARVNLDGVYELGEGYTYNGINGFYDGQLGEKCFTFTNNFSTKDADYRFKAYNKELLVDTYIEDLKEYKAMYLEGINGNYEADFDLFKKVFYTSSNYTLDQEYKLLDMKDVTNKFYLYLANGQVCDYLPVFANAYNNLIFWENTENHKDDEQNGKYAYITRDFLPEDEDHKEEISKFVTRRDFDGSIKKLWYFTDGDGALNEALVAHYFRKNYYLDVKTTYKQEVDRRGYVLFDIYDTIHAADSTMRDEGGKYLAICENEQMEVYKLNLLDVNAFMLKNLEQPGYATKLVRATGEEKVYIRLFAGCDVTMYVRDQSKDVSSMATGNYDEMIGYKFNTFTQTVSPEEDKNGLIDLNTLDDKSSGYKFSAPATTWVTYDYKNKSILGIDVEFEDILYDLTIKMQDKDTGRVEYALDGKVTTQQISHSLKNLKCGNEVMSRYLSYAGFTLQQDAFVLYYTQAHGHTLQEFIDAEQANGDVAGQIHTFVIDGTWLRENLYSRYITDYAIYPNGEDKATNMGDLTIQTEAITLSFGFITRDYASYTEPNERIINFENRKELGNVALARDEAGNYSALTPTFNDYIIGSDRFAEKTYWFVLDGEYYSLWQSELYYYDETSYAEQYVKKYSFPIMTNAPSVQHKINMAQIAAMVEVYEEGLIIANELRNINLLLDISPYVEQSVYVEADLCEDAAGFTDIQLLQDPNRGTRLIEISYLHNDVLETIQMSVNANANFDTNKRFVINYNSNAQSYTMLTNNILYYPAYIGMNLTLAAGAKYSNDYISVDTYSMETVDTSVRNVILAKCDAATSEKQNNGFEYVRFNAKPLHANYIYKFVDVDGTVKVLSLAQIGEYITETAELKTSASKDLYIDKSCNAFTYEVKVNSSKYVVEVKISGTSKGKATTISLVAETAHIISIADYAKAQGDLVNVEVIVSSNEASKIEFVPMIIESQTDLGLDEFGSYDILTVNTIDGEEERFEYKDLTDEHSLYLVDGEKVEITFNLKPGYRYVGFKYGNATMNTTPLVNSKITVISSFDVDYHAQNGITQYMLIVEKIPVNATLNTTNSKAIYKINGYDNNAIVYIGQTITFDQVNILPSEKLAYFYYLNKQGEKVILTNDGTATGERVMSLALTGEMIECCTVTAAGDYVLTFYSEIIPKYETVLTVTGSEYLVDSLVLFKVDNVDVSVTRTVNGKTVVYSAYFEKSTELNILASALIAGKYDIKFNNDEAKDLLNEVVVINDATKLTVEVTPKAMDVVVTEKLYENLDQLTNSNPTEVSSDDAVNGLVSNGVRFNNTATLVFIADKYQDRKLTQIVISGNDAEYATTIDLTNIDFKSAGTIVVNGYVLKFEQLENNDIRAIVSYTTQASITMELTYTQYKVINP